ncbi:ankyrin repeat and KH domain-containing protein mask-like [Haliotis rufescens]|uniref:ankyrin repeat and KH domain-containing protein mask-like n=1 Tax=Haliotis rufescens TaxID=6454 RepID=UPI00201E8EAD|nr:ankyrin repeat and KH domain-containing protein mask-like [Haliotis rufescens]
MVAAMNGHRDTFELLVKKGANLSPEDTGDEFILHWACYGGNADKVRYVLQHNVKDINSIGWNGQTAAMTAADKGYRVIFDLLIRKGADITVDVDDDDNDILHLACKGGNVNIVKYVLKQNNIDINTKGNYAFTPAMMAADGGHREILDLLMRKGADLTLEAASRCNVLHIACKGRFTQIVEYVISKDIVDINSQDFQGMSAVMLAAERGLGEVFDLLVSKSADLRRVNANQENILHLACRGFNMDIVKYIVTQNIVDDINTRTKNEETPLMIAAMSQNKEAFDLLLQKGASLALVDKYDNTILHSASFGGKLEIAEFILAQNIVDINRRGDGGMSAVMMAAFFGNREVFHLLEKKGANLSFADRNGHDILYLACESGNINIVKYVLSHVNLNTAAKKTTTSEAGDFYAVCDLFYSQPD